ncbi:hypothetical protein ACOZ4I_09220 [Haloarcula salina]|uniref:hypothetical protein n=1 Tax=Haloarcula salina TaxID=1429914 RepID=UPI003C6FA101
MFEDVDGPEQKTLIRLLIVIGIGLPILIEVATFGSMLGHHVVGDGGGGDAAPETPTAAETGVVTGDEILDETNLSARIESASVVTENDGWRVTVTVNATNTGQTPAAVRLGAVTSRSGTTVDGAATTDRIRPGESATVTESWLLPPGERPGRLAVTTLRYPPDGTPTTESHTVTLGDIPVSNR